MAKQGEETGEGREDKKQGWRRQRLGEETGEGKVLWGENWKGKGGGKVGEEKAQVRRGKTAEAREERKQGWRRWRLGEGKLERQGRRESRTGEGGG